MQLFFGTGVFTGDFLSGVMTRIEAFKNVVENAMMKLRASHLKIKEVMKVAN